MNRQQWLEATTVLEFACTCLVGLVWVAFSPVAAAKTGIVAFGLVGIWAALALLGGMAQRGARVGLGGLAITLAMHLVKPAILLYFVHSIDDVDCLGADRIEEEFRLSQLSEACGPGCRATHRAAGGVSPLRASILPSLRSALASAPTRLCLAVAARSARPGLRPRCPFPAPPVSVAAELRRFPGCPFARPKR